MNQEPWEALQLGLLDTVSHRSLQKIESAEKEKAALGQDKTSLEMRLEALQKVIFR